MLNNMIKLNEKVMMQKQQNSGYRWWISWDNGDSSFSIYMELVDVCRNGDICLLYIISWKLYFFLNI